METIEIRSLWPKNIDKWAKWPTLVMPDDRIIDISWCNNNLGEYLHNARYWCFKEENDRTLFRQLGHCVLYKHGAVS